MTKLIQFSLLILLISCKDKIDTTAFKQPETFDKSFKLYSKTAEDTFYISVNYKAEFIKYYLRQQNLPFELHFFKEEHPMGTAEYLSK